MTDLKKHPDMKVAYFINQYPKVSHSFIRREIMELEVQGVEVPRFSIRRDEKGLVDKDDLEELKKTRYLLERGKFKILQDILICMFLSPANFVSAFSMSLVLGRESKVGVFRHLLYLLEACVLNRHLREIKVDHVHAHFGSNSTAIVLFSHLLGGMTYSFTVHGPAEFDHPRLLSLGEKVKYASFVVAISSYGRSQLYRWCEHKFWKKIYVVHCALGDDFLENDVIPLPHKNRIICVGRLCAAKGQILLIEAVSQLISEGVDVELILAGDGPMRSDLEAIIARDNLNEYVKILGWISSTQVRQEIAKSKALVMPSFAEGLPVAVMEASAMWRPIITTAITGIPELIEDGENGWLITAGSIDELVKALHKLDMAGADALTKMGEKAHKAVLQHHNIHREAAVLREYFEGALQWK